MQFTIIYVMSLPRILVIGDCIYNFNNITSIECNDKNCILRDNHRKSGYYDEFTKARHPTEYQDAYKYWLLFKRVDVYTTYTANIPFKREDIKRSEQG
jgi:hypothetical protein